ncbi:MAG: hypothetical protein A2X19_06780 [Bacteroidetes bacterium GWE2_39_28]|nr:MAG: hypothetical protein A2X19_06780 [Bacteroidetes bacterium GWE2_39_28]OFY13362.1 MAG: hypothetical protein A2X16_00295 [Bacteroidetes bacterium GWF2_39_10]OFZ09144.1 MAG: hypothetical protein A2322_06335 [Bacteroidetes bacterium RIFOXYB2_FULL_39_7]OFZ12138.1 MAG: hypothetical protein A2465_08920 [Bacteroidetes bacterium RIFOXYC2_FULL_39_11]HCT94555.1 hypothetical protein [Rikenellaceae bacterium]
MKQNMSSKKHDSDVSIMVVSCDKYKDLWDPFFKCFNKYWSDCPYPIYLASNEFTYDSDPTITPILIGPDKDYSTNLIEMIKHIKTSWILLWFEDCFITSNIDTPRILRLVAAAQEYKAGYLKLTVDYPLIFTKDKNQEIGPIPKGIKYRSGIGLALYHKGTLQKLLEPGESAWQIDRSQRSNFIEEPFFALTTHLKKDPPIPVLNAVIKGEWSYEALKFMKKEGINDSIKNRKVQSIWSFLYIKLYLFRIAIYRVLRIYWYD